MIYHAKNYLAKNENKDYQYYGHTVAGYAYLKKEEFIKATAHYLQANELIQKDEKYIKDKVSILKNLGYIAKTFLAHEHALGYYNESLAIVSEEEKAGILYNLGNVYKNMEEYDSALAYFNKSLALASQFNQSKRVIRAKVQLGIIFGKKAWYEKSESQFRSIITETKTQSSSKYAGRAYHNLANNYMNQNDLLSAIDLFSNALELFTAETDRFITYMDMGNCYLKMQDYQNALAALQTAENLYSDAKPYPEYAEVYNLLATAYKKSNNTETAFLSLRTYGAELKEFLRQKEEIIKMLNKQRFEQLVNTRAAYNDLWSQLTTQRNLGILASIATGILLLTLAYKRYKSIRLKKAIARELNSI